MPGMRSRTAEPPPPLDRWWAVDVILVGWLAATAALVVWFRGRIPHAAAVAGGHFGAAMAYLAVKRAARTRPALRLVYVLSPFVLVLAVFQALGLIIPHLHDETADAALAALDLRIFGSEPTRWFGERLGTTGAAILQFCYTTYYFIFVALAAVLCWRRQLRTLLTCSGVLVGCFVTTYLGYYLVPAYGPRTYFDYEHALPLHGVAGSVNHLLDGLEYIKLDAFPSGHTALSVLSLLLLFRIRARIAWVLLPLVLGLVVSTVALRYHYAIDVLAGLLCTALWYPWGLCLLRRFDPPARHDEPACSTTSESG